jgi:hypothetical protein
MCIVLCVNCSWYLDPACTRMRVRVSVCVAGVCDCLSPLVSFLGFERIEAFVAFFLVLAKAGKLFLVVGVDLGL